MHGCPHRRPSRSPALSIVSLLALLGSVAPSEAGWVEDGVAVSAEVQTQRNNVMVPDGAGGAFLAWEDDRSVPGTPDIYAQRVDADGNPLWTAGGVPVCTAVDTQFGVAMVSDGSGGVIVAWADARGGFATDDVYAQRLDAGGVAQWTVNGVPISQAAGTQNQVHAVTDGAGGAIFVWSDRRSDALGDIYAQRVDGTGAVLWAKDGVAITAIAATQQTLTHAASDDAGGVLVAWYDARFVDFDVFVHRFTGAGVRATGWPTNGADASAVIGTGEIYPRVASDGTGGAVVVWEDLRTGTADVYSSGLSPTSNLIWLATPVCTAADNQDDLTIIRDTVSGDCFVAWEDDRTVATTGSDVYIQRIDTSTGNAHWTYQGAPLVTAVSTQAGVQLLPDGEGGVYATWYDFRTGDHEIRASRVDTDGFLLWASSGVVVCDQAGAMFTPRLAPHPRGGAFVSWDDYRSGDADVRIQRVEPREGYWGAPEPRITQVADIPGDQGGFVRVSWAGSDRDRIPHQNISHYSVWRATGAVSAQAAVQDAIAGGPAGRAAAAAPGPLVSLEDMRPGFEGSAFRSAAGGDFYWEYVGEQLANYSAGYSFAMATEADSTDGIAALHYVQVVAHTLSQFQVFPSEPDSGYSVDNLAPGAPLTLAAARTGGSDVALGWNVGNATDPDFSHYAIHRSETPGVPIDPSTLLATGTDTTAVDSAADPGLDYYYVVVAVDIHDNVSDPTNEAMVPGLPTGIDGPPTSLRIEGNRPNPFSGSTRILFGLPSDAEVRIDVFDVTGRRLRTTELGPMKRGWHAVSFDGRSSDARLLPSGVYFYAVDAGGRRAIQKMVIRR